ncbi:MAG: alpha-2-macroglobulin [Crocinitomicaceae bacterium]
MKLFLTLITSMSIILSFGQFNFDASWHKIDELEKKGLYREALKSVDLIIEKAIESKTPMQVVKGNFFQLKYNQYITEDDYVLGISRIEDLISKTDQITASILHSVLAEVYFGFYSRNSWKFKDRTVIDSEIKNDDIRTWDLEQLALKVVKNYQASILYRKVLSAKKLTDYPNLIIGYDKEFYNEQTLYQFLANRAFKFFSQNSFNIEGPAETFSINNETYFNSNQAFINIVNTTSDSFNLKFYAVEVLQELTENLLANNNLESLFHVQLLRLKWVKNQSVLSNSEELYEQALKNMTSAYKDHVFSGEAWYELAELYFQQTNSLEVLKATKTEKEKRLKSALICKQVITQNSKSFGAQQCKSLLGKLNSNSVSLKIEETYLPNQNSKFLITYKNLNNAHVKVVTYNHDERLNSDEIKKYLNKSKAIYESEVTLTGTKDLFNHSIEALLPELETGYYLIGVSSDKDVTKEKIGLAYGQFWVTSLTYQTKEDANDVEVMALCRKTGHPLNEAEVKIKFSEYNNVLRKYSMKTVGTYKTDKSGLATVKGLKNYKSYFVSLKSGDDFYEPKQSFYHYKRNNSSYDRVQIKLFTDRKLYRPGQTIYFKGIATEFNGKTNALKTNFKTQVTFFDANHQEIKKVELVTNEFGSFEGKFLAPYGALTGRMSIQTLHGSTNVQVEEYKRPKFSAKIEPLEGEYKLNDSVIVKGLAEAFAGSKISDATVKYRVQRTTQFNYWYWWYRPSPSKEVMSGETITDDKGQFDFKFKAIPDESVDSKTRPIFSYTISVDVIDINGETHSATRTFSLGYHSLVLSNSIGELLDATGEHNFQIIANSLNGEELKAVGEYEIFKLKAPKSPLRKRLWPAPDQLGWGKEKYSNLFPGNEFKNEADYKEWEKGEVVQNGSFNTGSKDKIEFKNTAKWRPGRYKYVATSKDKNGIEVVDESYFTVYNKDSKKSIDNDVVKVIPFSRIVKPNNKAQFLLSTAEDHLNLFYSIDFKGKTIKEEWLHLKNEQISIEFDVKEEHIGQLTFDFIVVKNNRSYKQSYGVAVPAPDHHLDISLESFRDKLKPGQDEEWTLLVKNAKNEKAQAELLATLYDASLDELFTKNSFGFSLFKPYTSVKSWSSPIGFGQVSGSNVNYYWNQSLNSPHRQDPYLNTFGYNSYSYGRAGLYRESEPSLAGAVMDMSTEDGAPSEGEYKVAKANKKESPGAPSPVADLANSNELEEPERDDDGKPVETEAKSIQPRTNFNETAFFYPQLHTNEAGEIRIKFTMPESLTKWRFIGLAHSKTLEIGLVEKELVTQKDLMVMPNMPRFFRENDRITISTKIANISVKDINGTATIKLIDPVTEKDITSQFTQLNVVQPFSVDAEGNTQISWNLSISDEVTAVKYQIIAQSLNHSDGEENVLPILSNRMMVTESMPMPISGKGSKSFTFNKLKNNNSTSLKHHQLTLEYTSNPAWYALQAMPYMMEYPYECAEQTFTRYYANAIATHVLNSKPKIKAIIDKWQTESPEAFLSNLNKNQELKSLMLEETPWVLNAKSESETKRNLSVLLDLNRMNGELAKALSKTIKTQSNSGGWAWFPGMRDNRYITQHIITGLGHLDVLGISAIKEDRSVRQMVEKGVRYLDREIVKDLERLKKYHPESYLKNNHLGYTQIQYLYMRSYFTDIKLNKATEEAVNYYKNQSEKYWLEFNIYAKGMIGLAAKRMSMTTLASDIYKSLKDNAIINEEFGMYWKSYTSGFYWYQAPIETQALMIEFFNEMEDMPSVEQLKMWLLKEKQTTHWKTTKQTAEAVYALLLNGLDLLATDQLVQIKIGGKAIEYVKEVSSNPYNVKPEAGTGYFKTKWNQNEISSKMADVKVVKESSGPAWGAMYWQYFEQLDKITFAKTPLKLDKSIHKIELSDRGEKLKTITDMNSIEIGDKVRIRIELRTDRNLEYVHMKDMRASGFEPISVISKYKYQGGLGYYQATKDAATNFFFDYIPKGTYVFEYDLRAEQIGDFSNGIATIQCMYAPEFTSHSNGIRLSIKAK